MTPLSKIQFYSNVKDNTGKVITVQDAVQYITGNKLVPTVDKLRKFGEAIEHLKANKASGLASKGPEDPKWDKWIKERTTEYDNIKKSLPAVTWSGTFGKRAVKGLKDYSGLLCIDIDKLPSDEALQALKKKIKNDKYTFLVFTSPSGKGIKVIVKVGDSSADHLKAFFSLESYYLKTYNVKIDESGKDVSRLCFLSPDSNFLLEPNSELFKWTEHYPLEHVESSLKKKPAPAESPIKEKPLTKPQEKEFTAAGFTLDEVKAFTDKLYTYQAGSRNNYCHMFSLNANRKGIDISETLTYLEAFAQDMDIKELAATVESAYKHNTAEYGKFAKKKKESNQFYQSSKQQSEKQKFQANDIAGEVSGKVSKNKVAPLFYFEHEDDKLKDKQGNPLLRYTLYYTGLIDFLEHGGYHRLPMQNGTYEFILYKDNICETIQPLHMKDYVVDWCKTEGKRGVLEMLIKGSERYFNVNKLNTLPYRQLEFVKDTATDAYFFFRNCYVKVTKDAITTHNITDFQKTLWKSSIIDRDFSIDAFNFDVADDGTFDCNQWPCEMAKYIALVSYNPASTVKAITTENRVKRFDSICSSIGYMLHGFKNKNGKAIVAVDHKIPEDKTEQNGGSGKSIVGESFRHLKSATIIDGREFREDYPFRFEMVGVDTQIVVMQDCKQTLDFGTFFVPITNDFTYNRRHTGYVTIKYEDSPKWWFDTNFTFKGDGSSFRRRQHIIEFDDYFNDEYTPLDEFKHYLFQDWDAKQWNLFFNFYFYCVQLYLQYGLIAYPESNYEQRKLLVDAPQEFIDFIDAHETKEIAGTDGQKKKATVYKIERNREYIKKDLMKLWNDESNSLNMFKSTPHQFTKWVKKYCGTKGLNLLKRKTNGVEYYTLADSNYKPHGKVEQGDIPF